MKLLKAFLIFFIAFGVMYFFTGFILADFDYRNWIDSDRGIIIMASFFITFFSYVLGRFDF